MDKFLVRIPPQASSTFMLFGPIIRRQFMAGHMSVFLNRGAGPVDDGSPGPSKRHKSEKESTGSTSKRSYRLNHTKGDLFSCPENTSLVHCISADVKMGKGIAVLFKKKFGKVDEIKKQAQKPGGLAVLKSEQRYIYNMVTKERYFNKPTYDSLRSSLQATKEHCVAHDVTELAMPRIGCGLDRLEWSKVSAIIDDVFKDSGIHITVHSL